MALIANSAVKSYFHWLERICEHRNPAYLSGFGFYFYTEQVKTKTCLVGRQKDFCYRAAERQVRTGPLLRISEVVKIPNPER